jgi:hypothetical protein
MKTTVVGRNLLTLGVALAFGTPALAATEAERIQALEQKLDRSLAVIEQLQKRLGELERPAVAAPGNAAVGGEAARRLEAVERNLSDVSAALASAKPVDDTGVPLHGFLDVNYAKSSKAAPAGTRNGFKLGALDLYLTPQFGPNVRSLIELAFEYGEGGGLATDLERLQIGYAFNDNLVLWGGRFHTPYGYWNTAFHHGAQIQTSITRPRFIAFEDQGGILPSHSVGAWVSGKQQTGLGKVTYDVWGSNGNRISEGVLDFNASGDDNSSPMLGFNASLSPKSLPGLTLGVHGLRQAVSGENADNTASGTVRTGMLGGYAYFENDNWEVISEYYRFRNRDAATGNTLGSWAGFAQVAYNVAPRLAAFVRVEKAALNGADPYFSLQESGSSYRQTSLGLRYELDPRASLKLQIDRIRDEANAAGSASAVRAQYAIRF